jgi:3-deoxy-D-manno-octulosonic acid kinase
MMKEGGRRIATSSGAMLADPASLGNLQDAVAETLFDPDYWRAHGQLTPAGGGRGSAWFISSGGNEWVLRHYRRGGFVANFSTDRYFWLGEARVRAFAEWRLLTFMSERGLRVPKPIAAGYSRGWFTYRCDLITRRIPNAEPLSAALTADALPEQRWRIIGTTIARFHRLGVDHADLNAHNILLDGQGAVSLIDFDRGRIREHGAWKCANLRRLHRSLGKIARDLPAGRFSSQAWAFLLAGYKSN